MNINSRICVKTIQELCIDVPWTSYTSASEKQRIYFASQAQNARPLTDIG
jgi:hypothetical protein